VKIGPVVSEEKILIEIALRVWHISSNISGCTGPIFTIFLPYESALHAHDASVGLSYFPMCQGTLPWQPNNEGKLILRAFFARLPDGSTFSFCNYLLLMPLYRVKFW